MFECENDADPSNSKRMFHALDEMSEGIRGKVLLRAKDTVIMYNNPSLDTEIGEVGKDTYLEAIASGLNRFDDHLAKVNASVLCYDRYGDTTRKMITGWIIVDPDDVKFIG